MFEKFLKFFDEEFICNEQGTDAYENFLKYLGGKQFGKGIFNTLEKNNLKKWTSVVEEAFPEFSGKFKLFAYDWLGRLYGITEQDSNEKVLIFEIGTGEVLEIPCDLLEFLNEEIPLHSNECLAMAFYKKWLRKKRKMPSYGRCIGYKVPLFLGGQDVIKNLEESDLEVYWYIITEVKKRIAPN